ncbi:MAG TPA: LapA family protein [Flavobacteriaceae bacterium]|nr:LapA family protein [Flavobacteriaceae bacterium]
MRIIKKILLGCILLLIVIFAVQNSESLTIKLFNWSATFPTSLLMISFYILGMTTGGLLFSIIRKLSQEDSKKKEEPMTHEPE